MNRLTERLPNGVVIRTGVLGDSVMLRLAAYEDTNLLPDEVASLLAWREAAQAITDRDKGVDISKMEMTTGGDE